MGILLTVNGIYNRSYQFKDLSTNRASTQISRLECAARNILAAKNAISAHTASV